MTPDSSPSSHSDAPQDSAGSARPYMSAGGYRSPMPSDSGIAPGVYPGEGPQAANDVSSDKDNLLVPLKDLLQNLWKRKLLVIAITLLFGILGALYANQKPKMYKSVMRLRLSSGQASYNPLDPYSIPFYDHLRWLQTQKELVASERVLATAYELRKSSVEFVNMTQDAAIDLMRSRLNIRLIEDTDLLVIEYRSPLQNEVADTLKSIATTYIDIDKNKQEQNEELRYQQLKAKEKKLANDFQELLVERDRYIKDNNVEFAGELDAQISTLNNTITELNRTLDSLKEEHIEHQTNIENLVSPDINTNIGVVSRLDSMNGLSQLRIIMSNKKTEYESLKLSLVPGSPVLEAARKRWETARADYEQYINDLIEQRLASEKVELKKVESKQQLKESQLRKVRSALQSLAPHYAKLSQFDEQIKQLEKDLSYYRDELLRFSPGVRASDTLITIVDNAHPPLAPYSPNVTKIVGMATFLGFIFTCGLVYFMELLDVSIHGRDDLMHRLNIFPLGIIPYHPNSSLDYLRGEAPPTNALIASVLEGFQIIWTGMQARLGKRDQGLAIVVSSAVPEEGKSTAVINLAYTIAKNGGRVLIVDSDMRRPAIARRLGLTGDYGLDQCLQRRIPREKAVLTTSIPNMDVLPSISASSRPTELLASSALNSLLVWARNIYDVVLLDTPPILTFADAMMVSPYVDGIVLVVHGGKTSRALVGQSRDLITSMNGNLIGGILNDRSGALENSDHTHHYLGYYYSRYGKSDTMAPDSGSSG